MDARRVVDEQQPPGWHAVVAASKEAIDAAVDVVEIAQAAISAASPQLLRMRAATAALVSAFRSVRAGVS